MQPLKAFLILFASLAMSNQSNADELLSQAVLNSPKLIDIYDFIRKNPNSSDYTKAVDKLIALSKQALP